MHMRTIKQTCGFAWGGVLSINTSYAHLSLIYSLFFSLSTHLFLTDYLASLLHNYSHMLAFIVVSSLNFAKKLRHKYHYLLSTYTLLMPISFYLGI